MAHANAIPSFSLCSADPKAHFSRELVTAWNRGSFTRAAVAFLTEGGVEFFEHRCLDYQDHKQCCLCITVQWPTDLDAVARLSPLFGPNLRIFLPGDTPVELGTDVTPMLHSKVIYTDLGDGKCAVFVGSHNWTSNGLNGANFEASVRVECDINDPFAADIREHLDRCADECVPFDVNDIDYYKVLQHKLSSNRPPAPDAEHVAAFKRLPGSPAVVIHAEADEKRFRQQEEKLFLPITSRSTAKWFSSTTPTTVFLFLYPNGTLFGHSPPSSRPILYQGPVGTNNNVKVSPSRETDVTCEIRNLSLPELHYVPSGNIPPVQDENFQVVASLSRVGPAEVPIYHRGKEPTLEIGVQFKSKCPSTEGLADYRALLQDDIIGGAWDRAKAREELDYQALLPEDIIGQYDAASMQNDELVFNEPVPERVIHLDVPERWLYPRDVEQFVRQQLYGKLPRSGVRIDLKPGRRKNA